MASSPAPHSFWRSFLLAGLLAAVAAVTGDAIAGAAPITARPSISTISRGAAPGGLQAPVRVDEALLTAPVPDAAPVLDQSGDRMPYGDLPGWRQLFAEDFTAPVALGSFPASASSQWGAYPWPWKDTSGFGRYAPKRTVSVANGVLSANIHTGAGEDGASYPLVAALTPKLQGTAEHGVTYGRFAVRFRADLLPGYKVAWLLWPDSDNQRSDGEIDFPEMNLDSPNVYGFMHRRDASSGSDQMWAKVPMDVRQWHTAVIEWSPNKLVFLLDGVEIGRTTERVPDGPMHWVLQTETALHTSSAPSSQVRGNVQIDWVAAWAYDPHAG
jgi:hypothetical protein